MFDVKRPDMTNKTFRLSADLMERLSSVAQAKKVSVNYLVIQCCEYALDNMVDKQETPPEESPPKRE
jgi:predicted transcriptional regulator